MTTTHCKRAAGLLVLALAALATAPGALDTLTRAAQPKGKTDPDRPQGKWSIQAATENGRKVPDEQVQPITFEFEGDRITFSIVDKSRSGSFKVDPSKTPKQFDMEMDRKTALGIYKIEKDLLTLCFGEKRPTKFEAEAGSGSILIVLKRGEVKLDPVKAKALRDKFRQGVQRAQSQNNLKQIALAMHNYLDTYKAFPPAAIRGKDGKLLLSWRVAILPYIEELPLYQQFKLDEPWDSAHNKKLLEKMPKIYAPVNGQTKEPHATYYQVFTGPGTAFEGPKGLPISEFQDGTSNTVLVVEAGVAVPWSKPEDLTYRPKQDLPKLGGLFTDGFNAALADGSVRWIRRNFDVPTFRLFITRNDGQPIDLDKLDR